MITQPPAQASDCATCEGHGKVSVPASDEPMRSLDERRAELESDALRINAGCKPKFGDWMRNPWASESNPERDGMFVQSKRVTGKFNPGLWYEMTDGNGEFWSSNGKVLHFIDGPATPRATADVERLDFSDITSILHNDCHSTHTMTVYFGSKSSKDRFLGTFGTMVLSNRGNKP